MHIEVDKESGFCPGVVAAIFKAEKQLEQTDSLYCLGDIVHNSQEVQRLEDMGLVTIEHDDLDRLSDTKVLLRAHGEPPSTYDVAQKNGIQIIDATCPVVLKLQKKIKKVYDEECFNAGQRAPQIVIFGKIGHAEVNGLVGQTEGTAIVIEQPEDLSKVDFSRPVRLFSQTTMAVDKFRKLAERIQSHMVNPEDFKWQDTICRQVANRIPHLEEFAARHDIIIFVSGKKSSNGKALFGVCQAVNSHSYLVAQPEEVTPEMIKGAESIGICGATSTPMWQMEQVAQFVRELEDSRQNISQSGVN